MSSYSVRTATREDVLRFYPDAPTVRAVVAEKDGEVVAIAAIAGFSNHWVMVSDMAEPLPGKTCFRVAKRIMDIGRKLPGRVLAQAKSEASAAFLERIGLRPLGGGVFEL